MVAFGSCFARADRSRATDSQARPAGPALTAGAFLIVVIAASGVFAAAIGSTGVRRAASAGHDPGLVERGRALTVAVIHGDTQAVAAAADWIGRQAIPDTGARDDQRGGSPHRSMAS
jgi:hypothetical protein